MEGELFPLKPGQRLDGIPHKAWNAFVEAARYAKGQKHSLTRGAVRDVPQTGIVRVKNCSGEDRDRFDVLGIDDVFPLPTDNPSGFKAGPVLHGITPDKEKHCGRLVVLLEPAKSDGIVSACIAGITVARLNIEEEEDWIQSADIAHGDSGHLKPKVQGSAKILWREEGAGTVWAVVRLSNLQPNHYLAKIPASGIPARRGLQTGSAECELFTVDDTGLLEPVRRPGGETVRVEVLHHGTQPIRGPVDPTEPQYLGVTFDGQDSWLLDPPKQTLLCIPVKRIKSKSWGSARELRCLGGRWAPIGSVVSVYNVCDYALLASQQIVAHFHEDTSAYLSIGCRCCDGSSSSSSSSSSDSSSSVSSESAPSSSSSGPSSSSSSTISSGSSSSVSSSSSSISSSSSSASSSSSLSSSSQSSSSSGSSSDSGSSQSSSGSSSDSSKSVSVSIGGSSSSSSDSSASPSSGSSGSSGSVAGFSSSSQSSSDDSDSSQSIDVPSGSSSVSASMDSLSSDSTSIQSESGDLQSSDSGSQSSRSASQSDSRGSDSDGPGSSESQSDGRSHSASGSDGSIDQPSGSTSDITSGSGSASHSVSGSLSHSTSESASRSESGSRSESASGSDGSIDQPSESASDIASGSGSISHSDFGSPSHSMSGSGDHSTSESGSLPSTSDWIPPSEPPASDASSDSVSRDISDSGSRSDSESDSRPSTSDSNPPSEPPPGSSSSGCTSSWIWSCGWELLESNCDDPEPPEGTGDYDGALTETAA